MDYQGCVKQWCGRNILLVLWPNVPIFSIPIAANFAHVDIRWRNALSDFVARRSDGRCPQQHYRTKEITIFLFSTKKRKRRMDKSQKLLDSPLNSVWDEGITSTTSDGSLLFYTFSPESDKRPASTSVYVSENPGRNGVWDVRYVLFRTTVFRFLHTLPYHQGRLSLFRSDMPGGYGGKIFGRLNLSAEVWLRL